MLQKIDKKMEKWTRFSWTPIKKSIPIQDKGVRLEKKLHKTLFKGIKL